MVLTLIATSFYRNTVNADETLKIDLNILTDFKPEAEAKKVYWTGEGINSSADMKISGTGVSIDNAKTVITVPKVKFNGQVVINKPTFVKSASAASWEVTEDENNFYATYNFNTLKGGQQITIPFPFSFKNDITPGGTTVTPTYEIFDSTGASLRKAEITYTAQVTGWRSHKWIWYAPNMYDRTDESNGEHVEAVRRSEYRDVKAPTHTPESGWDVEYKLDFRPLSGHSTFGKYTPNVVKVVDKLPEGAELAPRSIQEGWVYDANTHTATWEGKANLIGADWTTHNERILRKTIYLKFKNYPIYLNQTGQRNVPNEYVFKNKAEFYINPGTDQEEKLEERYANGVFEAYETVTPPRPPFGKGESFRFDAWGSTNGDWSNYYNPSSKDLTVHRGGTNFVHFSSVVTQTNNGSSYETPDEGGYQREIKRITWDMDEKLYIKFYKPFPAGNHIQTGETLKKREEFKEKYNSVGKKLYGIKLDGSKELIDSEVTLDKRVDLNDEGHKYKGLVLEFDEPLVLDNSGIGMHIEGYPDAKEKAKFDDGTHKTDQYYYLWMKVDAKRAEEEQDFTHFPKEREYYNHQNYSTIKMPNPQISFYGVEGNHTVPYGDNNVRRIKVGSHLTGNWTGMDVRQKVKSITLLPSGVVFKEHKGVDWADPKYRNVQPTIIENFRNTGKTAVIYEYELNKDGSNYEYFRANFDVDTTIYANAGNNVLEHYLVWENNDGVKPSGSNYKDALDLDGDGNFDEVFMKTTTTINFIPPLEIISKKTVALTPVVGGVSAPSQDIGKPVFYHINILNNTISTLDNLSVIDVLPYVGDHKIAPNDAGEYLPRNSQFNMSLTNSVESVAENAKVLERFDVLYSLTQQGADLASVRDAQWLRADQITDFTKVKNVKFVLKEGAIVKSKEEVGFFIPSAIPYDEDLASGSTSKNSVAFSTNSVDYIEANEATASNVKYTVDGVVFFDKNREGENNGKLNDEDIKLGGYTAQLMNEDGTPYLDYNNKPVTAITDSKGYYSMKVYARGKYFVQFTKKDSGEIFTKVYSKVGDGGNDATQNETEELKGDTPVFDLNPITPHRVRNAGILLAKGQVFVKKVNENGDVLSGVKFKLKDKNSDFEQELTTDDKGELRFEELKFSDYTLEEVETLASYVKDDTVDEITLTQEDSVKEFEKVNNFKRGSVIITKVDADNKAVKLSDVAFSLYQGDVAKFSTRTNNDGVATFENIPYGTYQLKETETVMGYVLRQDVIANVNIDRDGIRITLDNVTNTKIKADVTITKVDAENNETKLQGVVFGIYNAENDEEVMSATTDANGIARFNKVPYGSYYVKEKSAKEGYILSEEKTNLNVSSEEDIDLGTVTNQKIKGNISFTKVDADDSKVKLPNIEFGLYKSVGNAGDDDDEEVMSATSNEEGVVNFENVEYGEYYIKEKATLEGYVLSTEKHSVRISEDKEEVSLGNITNTKIKADVRITKVDAEDVSKKLAGVVFELRQGDEVKYTAQTNKDGVATFEDVLYGKYKLVEKTTLENYNLSSEEREVDVSNTKPIDLGNYTNQIKKGSLRVTKKDTETKEALKGVVFTLKQGEKEVYSATTNDEGVALFEGVVYGEYKLQEKTPLVSHNPTDRVEDVNIDEEGKLVVFDDYENTIKKGSVVFTKVDRDNENKKLEGISFLLKQGDEVIYEAISDAQGRVEFTGVKYGVYSLEEKETLQNYNLLEEKFEVNIDEEGKVVDLGNVSNQIKKGSVHITKVDAEDEAKKLAGVVFVLTQEDEEVYEATTDENGVARFTGVNYGKYTLKEKSTLENYNLSTEEREVDIDEEGKLVDLGNYTNKIKKGSIEITKVDEANKKLSGVEFTLLKDGKELEKKLTDSDGKLVFENLVYGDYEVVESKELSGYYKNDKVYSFEVRNEGEILKEEVVNKAIVKKSVNTGDESDISTALSLGAMSILSIIFLTRKKREEQ